MSKQALPCLRPKSYFYFLYSPVILKALHFIPSNNSKHALFKQEKVVKANVAKPVVENNCELCHVLLLLLEKCCSLSSVTEDKNKWFVHLFVYSFCLLLHVFVFFFLIIFRCRGDCEKNLKADVLGKAEYVCLSVTCK